MTAVAESFHQKTSKRLDKLQRGRSLNAAAVLGSPAGSVLAVAERTTA